MTKVLVDAEALKRVLNYMMDDEADDYMECRDTWEWDSEQLKNHIYVSLVSLEASFLLQENLNETAV